eukprot:Seg123.4 transcript_id=Seg123.4/GoldUCD/mRNA.D3Y31 product="28S ribosomal protein S6 mitochondrial" pseudo=true protein_id=Seg123.4/GoldUCD/D3Y31
MPRYELTMITRLLQKDGLASLLRRTATWIMDNGGVVRKFENLGEQELPYKMKAHAERFTHGRYLVMDFYLGADKVTELENELRVDSDLVRPRVFKKEDTFGEEQPKLNRLTCNKSYEPPPGYKNK